MRVIKLFVDITGIGCVDSVCVINSPVEIRVIRV